MGLVHHKLRSIVTLVVTVYINLLPARKISNLTSISLLIPALLLLQVPLGLKTSNLHPLFHDLGKLMITSVSLSKIFDGGRQESILRVVLPLDW